MNQNIDESFALAKWIQLEMDKDCSDEAIHRVSNEATKKLLEMTDPVQQFASIRAFISGDLTSYRDICRLKKQVLS